MQHKQCGVGLWKCTVVGFDLVEHLHFPGHGGHLSTKEDFGISYTGWLCWTYKITKINCSTKVVFQYRWSQIQVVLCLDTFTV